MRARGAARASDRAFAIDCAAVVTVGAAICAASHALTAMTLLVPAVVALRFVAWVRLPAHERGIALSGEAAFFTLCLVLGAGNDWNSVVRHRIYDYAVPHEFPGASGIPLWMLLYWGMLLRFVATLCRWERLIPPPVPADGVTLGTRTVSSPWIKVAGELVLVVATRQMIYAHYANPLMSWLPFAAALAVYAAVFRLTRHDRLLLLLAASVGPAVEVLFIQVGGLHRYHLGWLGGVPLWIVLWWMLAVLVWNDLTARLLAALAAPVDAQHRG